MAERARALLVELAWGWLRLQPESALTQWFYRRFAAGGTRMRRVGIVALARRLAIALWRYLQTARSRSEPYSNQSLSKAGSLDYCTAWHGPHHRDQRSTRPQRQRVTTEWPSN
jgi:hypothetical protein